ncbi:thioredoxin family protein [Stygiobacter electus]|uniref:Thioredoxin family protein n=1 Tax=Stygiobacter electus TaxID=3032292 RepID=A0AAE3NY28_9BACT|nr:thioredoxin family protein [Stygiobacter electus]MDF1610699.1 thioredoxin family protein [Stygiobacter electus]
MSNYELIKSKLAQSNSYSEYFDQFKKKAESNDFSILSETDKEHFTYIKLNLQRSSRIHKTYKPSDEIKNFISKIIDNQLWILITEEWCGDSAQIVPYIYEISKLNSLIDLKIFKRDSNLDLMELYLTNGTRSIPKLIVFDKTGNELFTWGPRPKEAQELINKLKLEGKTKDEFIEQLHIWYAKDRGKSLEKEMIDRLSNVIY